MRWWARALESAPPASEPSSSRSHVYKHSQRFSKSSSSSSRIPRSNVNNSTPEFGTRKRHRSSKYSATSRHDESTVSSTPRSDSLGHRTQVEQLQADLAKIKKDLAESQSRIGRQAQDISQMRNELERKARTCNQRLKSLDELRDRNWDLGNKLRQRDAEIHDLRGELLEVRDTAAQRSRDLMRTNAAHQDEVARIRRAIEDQESRRDDLIRKLAGDKADLERKWDDMERNWHTLPAVQEALKVAIALQDQLVMHGVLPVRALGGHSLQNPDGGRVVFCQMDRYPFKVPLMVSSFVSNSLEVKACIICANEYHDLAIKSPDDWESACRGFEGPWMMDIFAFPSKKDLACDHPMDVCKACIRDQIHSQLDSQGSKGWDELSCPVCRRNLMHDEIRRFASTEDFARYERYYLLEHLSKEPGFRWCLSGSCTSGQLYENTRYLPPHISCSACSFSMCFTHQVPWHAGLTCAEYDFKLAHAKDEEKSEAWKKENTKACPGTNCSRPIQKGDGCFHMTCRQCRHEFCWECLADWNLVKVSKLNHKEECYFRNSEVGPMGMRGATLDAAIGRW